MNLENGIASSCLLLEKGSFYFLLPENTFFRYKSIIGGRLRARHRESQEAEALIACNILNRMFELGRPKSFAIR